MLPILRAHNLILDYQLKSNSIHALRDVTLTLDPGEMVCLFGASGSGKSTLLNVLAGLDLPDSGSVQVCGKAITDMSEDERTALRLNAIGMVFQDNNLIGQFTARENIELILRCQGAQSPKQTAVGLLDQLGVADLADRRPVDMSGGQRQRVGIARALAGDRPIVLCDEPTGALDRTNSDALFMLLRRLTYSTNVGVIIATHDRVAETYTDRVLEITDGELVAS
ncbi:MAG: ABC transporter ATP-binding protein [Propionibacteriaceae bacterium]|nr:ABC transporter ATP-binding protein [Propionibacteriaceae bacterium]